ncbi:protein UL156 [Panine betaherpesvirus 2]|uniref:Protein UL156 n=1 Tax=Panine betaherpesvirus 2 TaxID=188763 RepID=Q8QRV9_9BETA|nr:protein UL156 [Panine betaherpesvirus 2]AAM00779.1 protein UL156 [Panine betaherpesvirus 2]QXV67895.1 protein UL156 [Panine betaherpesvirus 2]
MGIGLAIIFTGNVRFPNRTAIKTLMEMETLVYSCLCVHPTYATSPFNTPFSRNIPKPYNTPLLFRTRCNIHRLRQGDTVCSSTPSHYFSTLSSYLHTQSPTSTNVFVTHVTKYTKKPLQTVHGCVNSTTKTVVPHPLFFYTTRRRTLSPQKSHTCYK